MYELQDLMSFITETLPFTLVGNTSEIISQGTNLHIINKYILVYIQRCS